MPLDCDFKFPFVLGYSQALSKALTEDELVYLRAQFQLLEPNKDGFVTLDNFRRVQVLLYSFIR